MYQGAWQESWGPLTLPLTWPKPLKTLGPCVALRGEPLPPLPGWAAGTGPPPPPQALPAAIFLVTGLGSGIGQKEAVAPLSFVLLPGMSSSLCLPLPSSSTFLFVSPPPCSSCSSLFFSPIFPFSNHIGVFFHSGVPIGLSVNLHVCSHVWASVSVCTSLHVHACPVLLLC